MSPRYANVSEREQEPPSLAISTVIFALRPDPDSGQPDALAAAGPPHPAALPRSLGAAGRSAAAQPNRSRMPRPGTCRRPPPWRRVIWNSCTPSAARTGLRLRAWSRLCTGHWCSRTKRHWPGRTKTLPGSGPTGWAPSPSTTTRLSSTRSGGCATSSSTAPWPMRSWAPLFTLAQVREVYEAVLGRALDPANFRPPAPVIGTH